MKIGIFGITANPPHLSHLRAIKKVLENVDEVWVTLVYNHAFGKSFIDYEKRLSMLKLLVEEEVNPNIKIKELDKEYFLKFNETVYSYNLLKEIKKDLPNYEFKLVIGADNYKPEVWSKFYKYKEIEKEFGVIIIEDVGCHSTDIRNMINNNKDVTELVGKEIKEYIDLNNLYKESERKLCKM